MRTIMLMHRPRVTRTHTIIPTIMLMTKGTRMQTPTRMGTAVAVAGMRIPIMIIPTITPTPITTTTLR